MATIPPNERASGVSIVSILVVDDEEGVRKLLANVLTQKGYAVSTAESGENALAVWERMAQKPQLLITDLVMPGMGGADLACLLKTFQPGIKVLFCTGAGMELTAMALRAVKDSQATPKPFRIDELVGTVEAILQGPRA